MYQNQKMNPDKKLIKYEVIMEYSYYMNNLDLYVIIVNQNKYKKVHPQIRKTIKLLKVD